MNEQNPLFTLSISEFRQLVNLLMDENLNRKFTQLSSSSESPKENQEHFTIAQLCEFLSCSKVSIHTYKKQGLPYYRIGRKVLFKKSEVLDFMKEKYKRKVIG